jgi:tRNA(fMet)-specific endonuclease VapC
MVCLDTTFLADLLRKEQGANRKLKGLTAERTKLSTAIICIAELFYGAEKANQAKQEKEKVRQIFKRFIVLGMNEAGAEKFGEIRYNLQKTGQIIADRDIMIAAIALSNGENTIITRNRKDFGRIPELTVVTY